MEGKDMAERGKPFVPEGNRIPPQRGGSRFNAIGVPIRPGSGRGGVIAPERPREKELAPPPTPEEIKAANSGELAPRGILKKVLDTAKKHPVLTTGATLAAIAGGVAAFEAYQGNIPGIHRSVDQSAPKDVFNPTAVSGVIKPSMIETLPQGEIDKLDSFAKINDKNTVLGVYPLDTSKSSKPNAELNFYRSNGGQGNEQDRLKRTQEGFLNSLGVENVSQGTLILAPVDGNLTVFTASGNRTPINDLDFGNAAIDFLVDGKEFRLIISGGIKKNGTQTVLKNLTNAPIGSGMSPEEALQVKAKAIPIKKGTPIFQAEADSMVIGTTLRGNFEESKEIKIINGKEVIFLREAPTNLEFFSSPNGKLLVPTQ